MKLTYQILDKCLPAASSSNVALFVDPLNETMQRFEINTPERIAAFLANIAHESLSLHYVEEVASGAAYDTGTLAVKLGNTPADDGDGERLKGRGLFQITGTTNYKAVSRYFGVDFFKNPELIEQPRWAALTAGWYWNSRGLNMYADKKMFKTVCMKINGGLNGYTDRLAHFERIYALLKAA